MKYRADIDGLRAFAVLSVLFFHIDPAWLPGGFAGVDVFFVISGFLITHIISEQIGAGRFSVAGFYRNRINRIFPALFVVVAVSLLAGTLYMAPRDLLQLGQSAIATVLGVSNVLFWREYGGYFSAAAHEAPLLHTWSLAVEEQFYVVWPLLLMGLLHPRLRRHALPLLAVAVVALVGISESGVRLAASASYYLLPTRFFELAMGGLTSFWLARHPPAWSNAVATVVASMGMAMMLASFVLLRGTAFPGFNAVWPCLGTALLIAAGSVPTNPVSRLLAWRPFVAVGLLSYSLYLWHWPVIAAFNYFYLDAGLPRAMVILLLSLVLAWLSWRYVEQPFRHGREPFRQVFLRRYLAPVALLLAVVAALQATRGLPSRFTPEVAAMEAAVATEPAALRARCHVPALLYATPPDPGCVLGDARQPVTGLLAGDSFANHFSGMVDEIARYQGVALQDYTMNACFAIAGFADGPQVGYAEKCRRRNEAVYALIDSGRFRLVVLGGAWPDGGAEPRALMGVAVTEEAYWHALETALLGSLQRIVAAGATPVVIRRNASIRHAASCPVRRRTLGLVHDCSAGVPAGRMDVVWNRLSARVPALRFLDPNVVLCPAGRCLAVLEGVPLYRDDSHLNDAGARLLGRRLVAAGQQLPAGAAAASPRQVHSGAPAP